ncbi:hypothetical protein F0562_033846 [Nyssa sinensis]|uniref:X8 domain-containing protein n=1 Tax=Nyssa sinensis TaxID=561372 RepID=A0A5J5AE98_9ASTE|nr:hypothetical protein F0562_033846 [Nyssa sinensis]
MAVFAVCLVLLFAMAGHSNAIYCLCKDGVSDPLLQKNIDYACGSGADCSAILQNGGCYNPNTIRDHCNYAVNSYFQRRGQASGSCDFAGTATVSQTLTSTLPSTCIYPFKCQLHHHPINHHSINNPTINHHSINHHSINNPTINHHSINHNSNHRRHTGNYYPRQFNSLNFWLSSNRNWHHQHRQQWQCDSPSKHTLVFHLHPNPFVSRPHVLEGLKKSRGKRWL